MKVKIKIGDEVELWNHSKGKISNIDPSTCKFELTPIFGDSGGGWFHLMDIKFLNGICVDEARDFEFEEESLIEKYSRLIIKGNEDLSVGQFIFIHDNSYFFVEWYNGKWSDPTPIKLF